MWYVKKKWGDKVKERTKEALLLIGISVGISVAVGFILSLISVAQGDPFNVVFLRTTAMVFGIFGAGSAVGGGLLLITPIPRDLAFGFGNGLYYGTLAAGYFISKLMGYESTMFYLIGLIISSLVCYIVWLKEFKE